MTLCVASPVLTRLPTNNATSAPDLRQVSGQHRTVNLEATVKLGYERPSRWRWLSAWWLLIDSNLRESV